MNGKKLVMPILLLAALMLLISPAFAAITITWATPTTGTVYNNNPTNRQTIDLNFGWTDINTVTGNDHNFAITLRKSALVEVSRILNDKNAYAYDAVYGTTTSTLTCHEKNATGDSGSCSFNWTMPLNVDLPDGNYCVDVNFTEWHSYGASYKYTQSGNGLACFTVYTGFGAAAATRSMLLPVSIILIAAVMLSAVMAIAVLGADPAKTALAAIVATIIIAFMLWIFGIFTGMI